MKNKTQVLDLTATSTERPVILVFVRHYLPGDKSGGPVRSVANLVNKLGEEFDFKIVTSDRDWTDTKSYQDVVVDAWNQVGKANVFYLSPKNCSFAFIAKMLSTELYDVLYLNSFFDEVFTQKPLWAKKFGFASMKPVIIAPRGEFSPGARALKRWKKAPYTWIASRIGLFNHVIWHASTEHEVSNIKSYLNFSKLQNVRIASDIPSEIPSDISSNYLLDGKSPHVLRVVFLSRITPKKNLDFALSVLAKVKTPVQFNIYGPVGEKDYWHRCKLLMGELPSNITVQYVGALAHFEVSEVLRSHDLFFFPTWGENYGHVIIESLSVGTPILISDTTPWRNLEEMGVGWDLPLNDEQAFVNSIHVAARCSADARREWRKRVISYAREVAVNPDIVTANRRLFLEAIGNQPQQN